MSTTLAGAGGPKSALNALRSTNLQVCHSLAGGSAKTQSRSARPVCMVSCGQCTSAGGPVYLVAVLNGKCCHGNRSVGVVSPSSRYPQTIYLLPSSNNLYYAGHAATILTRNCHDQQICLRRTA